MDDAPAASEAAASSSPWPGDATTSVSSSSPTTSGPRSFVPDLPPGYHFLPTHDELVVHYLRPRLAGQQLQLPIFFDERVLDYYPDRLIEKYREYGDDRWFFFAKRERKHEGGNRPNRATLDNGHWNATGSPRQVRSGGKLVGLVRTLVFYEESRRKKTTKQQSHGEEAPEEAEGKANKGVKTDWTMYEYESFTSEEEFETTYVNGDAKMDVIVLCTIQKKKQKKKEEGETTKRKAKEKPRKKRNETPAVGDQVPNNLVVNFNIDPNASMSHRFADVSPPVATTPPQETTTTTMASVATGDSSQITLHQSTAMHNHFHYSIHAMTSSQFQQAPAPPPSAQVFLVPNSNSKMIMAAPQGQGRGGNNNCSIMSPIRWAMDRSFASDSGTAPPQDLSRRTLQIQSTITNVAAAAPEAHCGDGGFGRSFSNSSYGFAGDGRHVNTGADFVDVSSFPFPPQSSYATSTTQEAGVQNEVRVIILDKVFGIPQEVVSKRVAHVYMCMCPHLCVRVVAK